jgi:hypothetical protein
VEYPTLEEVNAADRLAICRWWRFLPGPKSIDELTTIERIHKRLIELGGMSPEISKLLGWR